MNGTPDLSAGLRKHSSTKGHGLSCRDTIFAPPKTCRSLNHPGNKYREPHISLVFREMWGACPGKLASFARPSLKEEPALHHNYTAGDGRLLG
jgi:hypothetical protein